MKTAGFKEQVCTCDVEMLFWRGSLFLSPTTAPVSGSGRRKRAAPGQSGRRPPVGEGATKRDGLKPAAQSKVVGGGHSCPVVGAGVWAPISGSRAASHGRRPMICHRGGCPVERWAAARFAQTAAGPSLVSLGLCGAKNVSRRSACVVFVYVVMLDFGIS